MNTVTTSVRLPVHALAVLIPAEAHRSPAAHEPLTDPHHPPTLPPVHGNAIVTTEVLTRACAVSHASAPRISWGGVNLIEFCE